jgi:hypothetical protein
VTRFHRLTTRIVDAFSGQQTPAALGSTATTPQPTCAPKGPNGATGCLSRAAALPFSHAQVRAERAHQISSEKVSKRKGSPVAPFHPFGQRAARRGVSVAAGLMLVAAMALPAAAQADYSIESFTSRTTDATEVDYTAAGGHPFQNATEFALTGGELKDAGVDLPIGFFGNPAASPRCPIGQIDYPDIHSQCPSGSRVGVVYFNDSALPLYNVRPDRGYPAQFVFRLAGTQVSLYVISHPRSESYGLTVGAIDATRIQIHSFGTAFCGYGVEGDGVPVGPIGEETIPNPFRCKSPSSFAEAPFLTNPIDCSDAAPAWKLAVDSWESAGGRLPNGLPDLSDPNWKTATEPALPVTGCDALTFDPTIAIKPLQETAGPFQADQPSGLVVDLDFPQVNDPTDPNATVDSSLPQTPEPKDITVKLPAGLSISPSSADGLGACSDQAADPAGDQVHYDNVRPVTCPDSSKIGTAVATSPLLALRDPVDDKKVVGPEPIPGDVYLLKPHPGDLPIGGGNQEGKFRLLIQLENAQRGVNFKLPGTAVADPQTGQITTVFTDAPQLPSKHLTVTLKSGARAPLMTPVTCGAFQSSANLVPWGTPEVPDANKTASFNVGSGPGGSACPVSPAARPFAPALVAAGTENDAAGAASPFTLKLTRNDGEGELSSLDLTMPPGFSAKLAGVPYCSEAAIAASAARSGTAEQASPSCPAASQLGTVTVGAGPGPTPFYTQGKAYLAGPYKGAPLSLETITPAVAGPFDLGVVSVRAALFVNPETAQVTVKTDPLPTILDGVPLRLRSIAARIDRPNFTLNPTNCTPMSVDASLRSSDGATASPSQSFQVAKCKDLAFKPGLSLAFKGATARTANPSVRATVTYPKGNSYANIAKTTVLLPPSEFIDNAHINNPCTRVQFNANACPPGSILGTATAYTPLLDQPLTGPVYFRSNGGERDLPDMVVDLNGQIHVTLVGFIDAVQKKGTEESRVRTRFVNVPDAPVSKFVLQLKGGKHGLIENSKNLCKGEIGKATVQMLGQNGKANDFDTALKTSCPKKAKGKGKGKGARSASAALSWLPRLGF